MSNYPDDMDHSRLSGEWELRVEKRVEELRERFSLASRAAAIIAEAQKQIRTLMVEPGFACPYEDMVADYICGYLTDAETELGVSDEVLRKRAEDELNEED